MRKINFAGGEPFLYPRKLGELCRYCKEVLGLESVSIVTNGTNVTEKWLGDHGRFVDVLGVSCDSFDERTGEAFSGSGCGNHANGFAVCSDSTAILEFRFGSCFADLLH